MFPIYYRFLSYEPTANGEPLDAYVLGEFELLLHIKSFCVAIIRRLDGDDCRAHRIPGAILHIRYDTIRVVRWCSLD